MWSIDEHIKKIHADHKPFQCIKCDFQADKYSKLQIHVKSIHESVTFPCPQCQHRVKSKNSLMFHIQTVHEGKKPFSCPQCDFKGALEINIKAHIKSMHPSTLTCSICEYKVADENILLNHLNMFHGTDKGRRKSSP